MTLEEKHEFLLSSARLVLTAFRDGRNPTFEQLDHLENAIATCDAMKICGHSTHEECDCVELNV